ncbi:A/G-specific adenine glycosylase [Buchnera aphidicola]|uniref:Adenine DNA glycosylase n=1 Tax=Buchnera aphidicola (Cinara strobi) TaxID=1921549 RepID=A0A3B1E9N2_9GAMM|nr:A/G-specific adenine glycosylase [Buchnera aphidicola]VAX76869.1 Adenine DNA glycosylase [Buchnera aphidicola (Cinara strobi)]
MLFSQKILNWFHLNGRKNLPWQKKNTYLIWLSEIMLQQTQVKIVIPYFKKFIKIFPNVLSVANSNINKILHIWSGLGYYQRAHNLHKTAIIIKNQYNGIFPDNFTEIKKLPGIGQSTAGAILSFSYNFRYPILDSNIKRILIRFHGINIQDKKKNQIDKILWKLIDQYLPIHNSSQFNQAMMDIGSLICIPSNPKCLICPLKKNCKYQSIKTHLIRKKKHKKDTIGLLFSIIQYNNITVLQKNNNILFWKGLFYFPFTLFNISELKWKKIKKNKKKLEINPFIHRIYNKKIYIIPQIIQIKKIFILNILKIKQILLFNIFQKEEIGIPAPMKILLDIFKKKIWEKK